MNIQRPQRRSSEVRGCLLRNFLDMRKRSLIRSESEDSGFSLESYEAFMSSSFDAEKFLEQLGFSGDSAPLIPDRFIPSLIHRISNMPDETVLKLDTRVWNSIDSFKQKENTLWFSTQASVECDLCINDLQRSYSVPADFEQGGCDSSCNGNGIYAMGNSSTSASIVQNWFSRFGGDSLSVNNKTKANSAHISNQSSIESGILSALSDDEAFTATNCGFNANDSWCPPKRSDDLEWSKSNVQLLKPSTEMDFEERRTSEVIAKSTPSSQEVVDNETVNISTDLRLQAIPSSNHDTSGTVSLTATPTSKTFSVQKGERCLDESHNNGNNPFSFPGRIGYERGYSHCKSVDKNVAENPTQLVSCNKKFRHGDLNSVETCEQVTDNLDSNMENVPSTEDSKCHYINSETVDSLQDFSNSIRRVSTPKTADATSFDSTKKRHSFDSAYLTADEKRRRFRLSHSKTHNALFENQDSRPSPGRLNEITDVTSLYNSDIFGNFEEENEVKHSDKLKPQKAEYNTQDISQNGGTSSEFSNTVSSVDISHHNESSVDISHHNESSVNTPSEMSDIDSNVNVGCYNAGNLDRPSEVSNNDSNVDTGRHIAGLDSPSQVSDIDNNLDIGRQNVGNIDSPSEVSDINSNVDIFNVDIERHTTDKPGRPSEVSDIDSNVDIGRHDAGNLDTLLGVSSIVNIVERSVAPKVISRSDSESSEQYFSCDELSIPKTPVDGDFAEHDGGEEKKKILIEPVHLFPCLLAEQRVTAAKMTSQMLSRDKALFRSCNRATYAKYKEHFILNKILKRSLKFSVLCPIEKMSRHFLLENDRTDNETFSQILNSPPSSLKSKMLEKHAQSVTYGKGASHDALPNFSTRKKSVGSITGDKAGELDNNKSSISKPFVHNLSLTSEMRSPQCEVRLINYDGLALFWAARNTAQGSINCDSVFYNSVNSNTINKRFISGVRMGINSENGSGSTSNKVYYNEVLLEVNSEEGERNLEKKRLERCITTEKFQSDDTKNEVQNEDFSISKAPTSTENPCARALKDLEDLKTAIRKAKETRMSASRELKLLQELLHNGDTEGDETAPQRTTLAMSESKLSLPNVEMINGDIGKGKTMEALSEIQQKSAKEASQNTELWEEEIRKAKEEISQVCHEKLSIMEEKLRTTEDELARALMENTRLKDQLEMRSAAFPVCKCNAEAQHNSDFSHMNGISDEDPKIISVVKPSVPTKNFWQEWDRLQSDLMKAERKADELNILLNRKLIELNRMQLTLSKQTKEMILLEKAYFQLRSHLSKRKLNKSGLSHQSSSGVKTQSSTEKASETLSKTTDPEIPP